MGGRALKTIETHRLDADSYRTLAARVVTTLESAWPRSRPQAVRAVFNKADFGDLDVLLDRASLPRDPRPDINCLFAPHEVVHNGMVWSFDVDAFQVDLIMVRHKDYQTAVDYFAWNDAGNLIGRVAHRMGFKFGFDGLTYKLRDGTHLVAEIPVSQDMPAIFRFLGYDRPDADYTTYGAGFGSLEAMFAFVAASRYFDAGAYVLAARNHAARTRDRKRPSYRAFLDWIEALPSAEQAGPARSPARHLERAKHEFPAFAAAYRDAIDARVAKAARKTKFNGFLVAKLTGLSDKPLGEFMRYCKAQPPNGHADFASYLDETPQAQVEAYITDLRARWPVSSNASDACQPDITQGN